MIVTMAMVMIVVVMTMMVMMMVVMIGIGANTAHMVVVSELGSTDTVFEADDLLAVMAKLAVHVASAFLGFMEFVHQRLDDQGMVVEITGLDNPYLGMRLGIGIYVCIDAIDQASCEKEVGEYDDIAVAQAMHDRQRVGYQRLGYA